MKMRRLIIIILLLVIPALLIVGVVIYGRLYTPSVSPVGEESILYIPEGASYEQVMDTLRANLEIKNIKVLRWVAEKKKYPSLVKPGKYVISKPLSSNDLINILRGGRQMPVRITFNNVRTLNELAGKIGGQIEADSAEIMEFFSDPDNYTSDGFSRETVLSVFIPDTYEFYWNTSPRKLYGRMLREYGRFWDKERIKKSEEIGLSPQEVSTLASIVDEEVTKNDEKPRIAGVYLNRLRQGIPLQADPTVRFAINNFSVNRILYKHLETDSPYNTYKYSGLPPGPIACPSKSGIDAVLNAEKHNYLYFAARPDFSGYHNFAATLSEHNKNARLYQRELNRRRIYR
jgi:UPF0755 protein